MRYPAELLRKLRIVDTPGTNAILRQPEAIARGLVLRSDLVLFVTSADRPFTESERAFLENIRQWGKKVVVVINKGNVLDGEAARCEVETLVRSQVRRLLDFEAEMFLASARVAGAGLGGGGLCRFRDHLRDKLTQEHLVALKLRSPLGVLGLAVIPWRRGITKCEFRSKMEALHQRLAATLEESLRSQLGRGLERLRRAMPPHRRSVLEVEGRLHRVATGLDEVSGELAGLESLLGEAAPAS